MARHRLLFSPTAYHWNIQDDDVDTEDDELLQTLRPSSTSNGSVVIGGDAEQRPAVAAPGTNRWPNASVPYAPLTGWLFQGVRRSAFYLLLRSPSQLGTLWNTNATLWSAR